MIVVDTSVWIAHFHNETTPQVAALRDPNIANEIIIGDLVLLECLQGARDDGHASKIESALQAFRVD